MSTLDGAKWSDVGNKEDFLYVYGGGTDWDAAERGWENEHNQYLLDHGWNDNQNSGGSGSGSGSGSSGTGNSNNNNNGNATLTNPANNTAAIQAANYAAQIKYQNARLKQLEIPQFKWMKESDKEKQALAEATQEWLQTYQTSLLTGKFKGQDTVAWAAQQAALTGYFNGAPTLEREKQEADNVFRTAQLIASLRGPKNAFQMSEVITNGGLNGVLAGASGKYGLPSFGGGTGRPEPVTLAGFLSDAANGVTGQEGVRIPYIPGQQQQNNNQYGYGSGQVNTQIQNTGMPSLLINQDNVTTQQLPGVSYSPSGVQAPANQYNYQGSPDGNSYVYPPGVEAPTQAAQVSSSTPQDPAVLNQQTAGGLYGYASGPAPTESATAAVGAPTQTVQASSSANMTLGQNDQLQPYQLNAKATGRLNPYNKDLLWAYYEKLGWDPAAAEAEYNASLPRYGGPQSGRIAGVV